MLYAEMKPSLVAPALIAFHGRSGKALKDGTDPHPLICRLSQNICAPYGHEFWQSSRMVCSGYLGTMLIATMAFR